MSDQPVADPGTISISLTTGPASPKTGPASPGSVHPSSHRSSIRESEKKITEPQKSPSIKKSQGVLQIGGENAEHMSIPSIGHLDLNNRDPAGINGHLKVAFEEVFAEPHHTIFSFDSVWRIAYQVFTLVKLWTYRITSLILAIPAACCWAITFACLSFCHIWCCVPAYRCFMINMTLFRAYFEALNNCCCAPVFLAIGRVFSSFRVTVIRSDAGGGHGHLHEVI